MSSAASTHQTPLKKDKLNREEYLSIFNDIEFKITKTDFHSLEGKVILIDYPCDQSPDKICIHIREESKAGRPIFNPKLVSDEHGRAFEIERLRAGVYVLKFWFTLDEPANHDKYHLSLTVIDAGQNDKITEGDFTFCITTSENDKYKGNTVYFSHRGGGTGGVGLFR